MNVGSLISGETGSANVTFNWPESVKEVRFTVNFSANSDAYTGSSSLSVLQADAIKHVVFFIKENRSFDNYPGGTGTNLGQQELQVYTGGGSAGASAVGLAGFINQVIRTGT